MKTTVWNGVNVLFSLSKEAEPSSGDSVLSDRSSVGQCITGLMWEVWPMLLVLVFAVEFSELQYLRYKVNNPELSRARQHDCCRVYFPNHRNVGGDHSLSESTFIVSVAEISTLSRT